MQEGIQSYSRHNKLILVMVFLALSLSILTLRLNPPTGYELDIYFGSPMSSILLIFLCVGVSSLSLLHFSISRNMIFMHRLSCIIGLLTVVGLPAIRSHFHIGEGDMMTHIGYSKDLLNSSISPIDMMYPLSHTLVVTISKLGSNDIYRSYLLIPMIIVLLFVSFSVLTVRRVFSNSQDLLNLSFIIACLLLTIDQASMHIQPSPRNLSLYFTPLIIFTAIFWWNSIGYKKVVLFLTTSVSYILIHPQIAIATFLGLFALPAVWCIYDDKTGLKSRHQTLSRWVLLFLPVIITWSWIQSQPSFRGALSANITRFLTYDPSPGGVETRSVSLTQVGGSIEELFIKIFLASLVLSIIATLPLIKMITNREILSNLSTPPHLEKYYISILLMAFPALICMFIFMLVSKPNQFFRYYGVIMVMITLLSPYPLYKLMKSHTTNSLIKVGLCIMFMISLLVVHPSPYIYQDSEHVTESHLQGHEHMIEYRGDSIYYSYVRSTTSRYGDALYGVRESSTIDYYGEYGGQAPEQFAGQNLHQHYGERMYLIITTADRSRDPILYKGFRYSSESFKYLDSDEEINKIKSNGELTSYALL